MGTINPDTSGAPTGNLYVDALVWGGSWAPALGEAASLTWTMVESVDFGRPRPTEGVPWSETEAAALRLALSLWADVAQLTFTEAAPGAAGTDLTYLEVGARNMYRLTRENGVLGFHEVPDGSDPGPLTGVFSVDGLGWTDAGLARGGYGFVTLVHEIGHGLGLAHPHDGGGDGQTFPGVSNSGDTGKHDLNQGIWTVMSYIDGWRTEFPHHDDDGYGWEAGPMALDIAAVQAIYGANTTSHTGDDSYALPTANGPGAYWSCVWDAGGADVISAEAATGDAVLDLRAAPLTGRHAGGYVSHVLGVVGGVTIAHGVVVEDAVGGAGADSLTGNEVANRLTGGAGADSIAGRGGADTITGGGERDSLSGGGGRDQFVFDAVPAANTLADVITDFTPGIDVIALDHAAFTGVGAPGPLAASAFALGRQAAEADDRILYDSESGQLRWDADGKGGDAASVFAKVGIGLTLDATSFWIL